jgi:transposase
MIPFFRKLPPCLVGMEACATSHHWARQLQALGHTVRIMPANYVKPYVKRNKNDARDAAAICEAVTRPTMRFVAVKSPEQQSLLMCTGPARCWSVSAPCWSTPCVPIWPNLALLHRLAGWG